MQSVLKQTGSYSNRWALEGERFEACSYSEWYIKIQFLSTVKYAATP
jgi:hypothetical protein